MGLQAGIIKITGTIDNLTFYKMGDKYYVRKKSSLTRNKVLNSPAFKNTNRHADEFKLAIKIASRLYRPIKKEDRNIHLFRAMIGRGKTLLHKGYEIHQIKKMITDELIQPITDAKQKTQPITYKKEKPRSENKLQLPKLNKPKIKPTQWHKRHKCAKRQRPGRILAPGRSSL